MSTQIKSQNNFFKTISTFLEIQGKNLLLLSIAGGTIMLAYCGYRLWKENSEKLAHYDFNVLIAEFESLAQSSHADWTSLLEKFDNNYKKHSSSGLLPYYLGYKVHILLRQNKREEALKVLDDIIIALTGSEILPLYRLERALIQLDSENEVVREKGLDALKILAQDNTNNYRDSAQFYLGRYYWATNNIAQARTVWQQLLDEQHDEKMAPSPWINFIQDKLNITIAER